MRIRSYPALFGLFVLTLVNLPARADSTGNTVSATTNYPDSVTVFTDLGTAVVGPGLEYTDAGGFFNIDVGASTITSTITTVGTFLIVPFEGFEIQDLTDAFSGVSFVSSTIPGFTAADVTFSDGTILENYAGLAVTPDEVVIVSTTNAAAATPEPSSLILLGTGLIGFGSAIRRRHA